MAIYQKRPETIDAVQIGNPPQDPPFHPPIPAWLTEALAHGRVSYRYDAGAAQTIVTVSHPADLMASTAVTGDYVTRDVATLTIWTLNAALLEQLYARGPAEPVVAAPTRP